MCFGRLVFGFASGVILSCTPKMVSEIIPPQYMDKGFGMSTSLAINVCFLGCLILAGGMPDDPKELAETKYWMLIFGV
jgi:MFS family permease